MSNFTRTLIAWLSIGSTYSYLTALRLEKKKKSENLDLLIKPFSIRNIMKAQNNIPFPPEREKKQDTCGGILKGEQRNMVCQYLKLQFHTHYII